MNELSEDIFKTVEAAGYVIIPKEPSRGLLMSMALRVDHAIGCPGYYDQPLVGGKLGDHDRRVEMALDDARKMYEEVVGNGFYNPNRESYYLQMIGKNNER